jgi:hypothetical protein
VVETVEDEMVKRRQRERERLVRMYVEGWMAEAGKSEGLGVDAREAGDAALEALRLRFIEVLQKRPDDVRSLMRGMEALVRMAAAEGRMSGKSSKRLKENWQAVLDGLGDELQPPDSVNRADAAHTASDE